MKKTKALSTAMLFTLTITSSLPAVSFAAEEGSDQLRLQTGMPKKIKETIFSSQISWKQEDGGHNKAKGLTYIDGSNTKKQTTDIEAAKKIAKSLNSGINYEPPHARGAVVKYTENKAEFIISNTSGFDLTRVIFGDYTNQKLQYNIPGKSFSAAGVAMAIDLVYSAEVDYIDNFSSNIVRETAGGAITVTIDNNTPIEIPTKGKNIRDLEKEIDKALGDVAHFSSTPIYPNIVELKSRNYKPFDGGEVQILNLKAKSITIDIADSGLGVLTKFRFPAVNAPEDSFEGSMMNLVGFLLVAGIATVFYARKKSKATE